MAEFPCAWECGGGIQLPETVFAPASARICAHFPSEIFGNLSKNPVNLSIFIELFSGIYRKQVALPGGSRSNRPRRFRPISRRGKCVIGNKTSIPAGRRIPDDRVEGAAQFPKEGERRPARERTLPASGSPRVCGTRTRTDLHPSTPPARAGSRPEPPRVNLARHVRPHTLPERPPAPLPPPGG